MLTYLLRRLVFAVALVFTVSSASLLLTRLAPGDYASESLGIGAGRQRLDDMRLSANPPFLRARPCACTVSHSAGVQSMPRCASS